jgi:hypothetical protein
MAIPSGPISCNPSGRPAGDHHCGTVATGRCNVVQKRFMTALPVSSRTPGLRRRTHWMSLQRVRVISHGFLIGPDLV